MILGRRDTERVVRLERERKEAIEAEMAAKIDAAEWRARYQTLLASVPTQRVQPKATEDIGDWDTPDRKEYARIVAAMQEDPIGTLMREGTGGG